MPIDAMKTILQVEGADGLQKLGAKIRKGGPFVLFHGSIGAMSATFVGHYPWFYTYNYLNVTLPNYDRKKELPQYLLRNALIGAHAARIPCPCIPFVFSTPSLRLKLWDNDTPLLSSAFRSQ